ncbi:MAG: TerC family protein, partial [bacterium]|nr:TerC family protein [bacterium]
MENLLTVDALISLLTLALLEIVLGIDNIVVLAILSGKLPKEKQSQARKIGLGLAMFGRIALLTGITWVMHMTKPVCSLPFIGPISVKDI